MAMPTKTVRSASTKASVSRQQVAQKDADHAEIVNDIRGLLEKHAPPFEVRRDAKGGLHLWSVKDILVEGRKKKEIYFAGVVPQKGYVSFHYMPVYTNPEQKAILSPELLALLKTKSCFHVKQLDPAMKRHIRAALASGYKIYQQRGWV